MNTKKCTRCGEVKVLEDYPKDKRATDGRGSHCKVCQGKLKKAWKEKQEKVVGPKQAKVEQSIATGEKKCTKCDQVKPLSEYHKDKRSSDGHYSHCKDCHYKLTHAYEQTDRGKDVVSKSRKEWYEERGGKEVARERSATPAYRETRRLYRQTEDGKEAQKRKDAKRNKRYPEKVAAKNAVSNAVKKGFLPSANTLICASCHQDQAVEYHHHLSYAEEHWLDVIPLCKMCHAKTYTQPHE